MGGESRKRTMLKPDSTPYRIYCAGPLFNASERAEMEMLADTLEQAAFKTFLPHRDGFLFAAILPAIMQGGYPQDIAQWLAQQAIFALDVYQVLVGCDAVLVNLNGRVPDEGAVCEGAVAWMAGKAVVLFKDDARSLTAGLDNPLLAGLAAFRPVTQLDKVAEAMDRALRACGGAGVPTEMLPVPVRQAVTRGHSLAEAIGTGDVRQVVRTIIERFDVLRGSRP